MALKQQSNVMPDMGNETPDSSSKDSKGKEELKAFVQDTTLHGARFLFAENIFRRLLWTLALIACVSYCFYQVFTSVTAFYHWPFNTKISTSTSKGNEFLFPAVTLCNLNAFNTRRFRDEIKMRHNINEKLVDRKLQDISLMVRRSKEMLKEDFKKRNPELFLRQETAIGILSMQGNISHQIDEMLLPSSPHFYSCSINGRQCTAKNFTKHLSSAYGQCYTFNSVESDQPLLPVTVAGRNSGLKLRLNIERDSYIRWPNHPSAGLAMIVHDQKSFPFMEEFGIAIQPGISTFCALKRKKMINLKAPYETNCTNGDRSLGMFNSDAYVYTKQACQIKCRNDYIIKRCGCTPPEYKANVSVCAPNDTVHCVYSSYEEFGTSTEKIACEQNCPEPCGYVAYEASFSYSALQTKTLADYLMEFLNDTKNTSVNRAIYEPLLNMTETEREKYIEKNIISLDIYFEDLSYEIIKQTPVYEVWNIIGNLGGMFGLFLGMSLLTILEFLDFIFRRICYVLKSLGQRKSRTVHVEY